MGRRPTQLRAHQYEGLPMKTEQAKMQPYLLFATHPPTAT